MSGTLKNLKTKESFRVVAFKPRSDKEVFLVVYLEDLSKFLMQHVSKNLYFVCIPQPYLDIEGMSFEEFGYILETSETITKNFGTGTFLIVADNLKLFKDKYDQIS